MLKKLLTKILLVSIVMMLGLLMLSFNSGQPPQLGVKDGQLSLCPASPNCVSTQTQSTDHSMPPIPWSQSQSAAIEKIKAVVERDFPRSKLIDSQEGYLRYEFHSLIFRFVDDVEFYVPPNPVEIHFRSASRVGHSDLGANKSRMQKIAKAINESG